MTRLALVSGKQMCKILEKLGFEKVHQVGSHARYVHSDGRKTVISLHANEDISRGLLREVLRQISLTPEEYEKLRREL